MAHPLTEYPFGKLPVYCSKRPALPIWHLATVSIMPTKMEPSGETQI